MPEVKEETGRNFKREIREILFWRSIENGGSGRVISALGLENRESMSF